MAKKQATTTTTHQATTAHATGAAKTTATTPSATGTTGATATVPAGGGMNMPGIFAWFAAWAMVLGVLYALSKTRAGHTIVYYVLWLSVVFVVVSHSNAITSVLQQGNITQGQQ